MENIVIGGIIAVAGIMLIVTYFVDKPKEKQFKASLCMEHITIFVTLKTGEILEIPLSRKDRFISVEWGIVEAYVWEYAARYAAKICKDGFSNGNEWIKPQDIEKIMFSEVTREPLNQ